MSSTPSSWRVRQVEDSPVQELEQFTMFRILDGSTMENIGCEFVTIHPGEVLQPHIHKKSHAIILVLEGSGYALLDGEKYPIKKHSVVNIPPGVKHGLESQDESLVVYGFQSPGIIDDDDNVDIFFTEEEYRQGTVTEKTYLESSNQQVEIK